LPQNFENEFFLLRRNAEGALEPADNTVFCATGSMNLHRALITDLAISPEAGAFIAGILDHLPALCAVTIPSKTSYRRIQPHFWAGAFRAWGCQNREAAVRVCKDKQGTRASRFEYKTADATANPCIALGALIAAGLDGLNRNLELPEEVTVDPALISEKQRIAERIDRLL
jgi:glutamine synthetase